MHYIRRILLTHMFCGIGADRFKLINNAARDLIEEVLQVKDISDSTDSKQGGGALVVQKHRKKR